MRNIFACLLYLSIFHPIQLRAQDNMPPFHDVMVQFFTHYSHERQEPYDRVMFAKKKTGWFVDVVDQLKNDSVKSDQLFWSIADREYKPLAGFAVPIPGEEIEEKFQNWINENPTMLYSYKRCRYYGYNEWDADMINDFGAIHEIKNDTLLEGLARAYGFYAGRYNWYGFGGSPLSHDTLQRKLGRLEMPSEQRILKSVYHLDKTIELYKKLETRNPAYETIVGNAGMKVFNEQFHKYQQLLIAGYTQLANEELARIKPAQYIKQIGYNYLSSCPPNAILITYGDNDTYPLWYVQDAEKYRRDVTVLNNSLLGSAPYIDMIKKKKIVDFSATKEDYGKASFDYSGFKEKDAIATGMPVSLPELIRMIRTVQYPEKTMDNETLATYYTKKVVLKIDKEKFRKLCMQNTIGAEMNIQLGEYLMISDFMKLDIIASNLYKRPVCFTVTEPLLSENDQQQEGIIYRVVPTDQSKTEMKKDIEIKKLETYITNSYKPIPVFTNQGIPTKQELFFSQYNALYSKLIDYYVEKGNKTKVKLWADKYFSFPHRNDLPYSYSSLYIARSLLQAEYNDSASVILDKFCNELSHIYKNPGESIYFFSRKNYQEILDYILSLQKTYNLDTGSTQKLIDALENN